LFDNFVSLFLPQFKCLPNRWDDVLSQTSNTFQNIAASEGVVFGNVSNVINHVRMVTARGERYIGHFMNIKWLNKQGGTSNLYPTHSIFITLTSPVSTSDNLIQRLVTVRWTTVSNPSCWINDPTSCETSGLTNLWVL